MENESRHAQPSAVEAVSAQPSAVEAVSAQPSAVEAVNSVPDLSVKEAGVLAHELYGLAGELDPLPSHQDQNFRLRTAQGGEWVLKIANTVKERRMSEAQAEALEHLAGRLEPGTVPRVHRTLSGDLLGTVECPGGRSHAVHLLSYLPGTQLADVWPRSTRLLESLGKLVATVDRGLADFSHPALDHGDEWDTRNAPGLRQDTVHVASPQRRHLADRYLGGIEEHVLPRLGELPVAVIHNDGNIHNVLVAEDPEGTPRAASLIAASPTAASLIDFDDVVRTCRVFGPAIAAAYAVLDEDEPLAVAAAVVAGFHRILPLDALELEMLFPAMLARLATTVTVSARQRPRQPDNEYLTVCEKPAWIAMERLAGVDADLARRHFARACGL